MATVMYIPEKKQSLGAMKGVMSYVCQEKKTVEYYFCTPVRSIHTVNPSNSRTTAAIQRLFFSSESFSFSAANISMILVLRIVRVLNIPTIKKLKIKKPIVSKTVSGNSVHDNS